MRKLLSAGLFRTTRHPVSLAILLVLPAVLGIATGNTLRYGVDDLFLLPMLFAFGAFVALSWGREHGDGVLRNKVIAGHSRGQVFFAELLLNVALCTLMMLIFAVFTTVFGFSVLTKVPATVLLRVGLCLLLSAIGMGALLSAVCCLISNRALSAIVGVLLVLCLMYGATSVQHVLDQEPTFTMEYFDENGEFTHAEEVENAMYVPEPFRTALTVVNRANPFGQLNQCMAAISEHVYDWGDEYEPHYDVTAEKAELTARLNTLPLISLFSTAAISAAGFALFRRKNLK